MEQHFTSLLKTVFLQSSQMAYVEGAKNTASVLCHMDRLFRYWIKADEPVLLAEEIAAIRDFVAVVSLSSNRTVRFSCVQDIPGQFITRHELLIFLCQTCPLDITSEWIGSECDISIDRNPETDALEIAVRVTSGASGSVRRKVVHELRSAQNANADDCR